MAAAAKALGARHAVALRGAGRVAPRAPARAGAVGVAANTSRAAVRVEAKGRPGYQDLIKSIEAEQLKTDVPNLKVGMQVKVGVTVVEGQKSRVQPFSGTIISMHKGGLRTNVKVRRVFQGIGVERTFPVHSPLVDIQPVKQPGEPHVRRAKLYYLRDRKGKAARLRLKFKSKDAKDAEAAKAALKAQEEEEAAADAAAVAAAEARAEALEAEAAAEAEAAEAEAAEAAEEEPAEAAEEEEAAPKEE